MIYQIRQSKLSDEIKKKIFSGFSHHAVQTTGMDGFDETITSFEMFDSNEFIGAVAVRVFWKQLQIKYLFVEEKYRRKGIGKQLMHQALEFGKQQGCQFAFVETMSFQAPEFYTKQGFSIEFSRGGYANNCVYHYLKRNLDTPSTIATHRKTRLGVYGVAMKEDKMLAIRQGWGPYAGKWDFPGGGLEFGESPEEALRREFAEEVAMEFDSMTLLANLTTTVDVPQGISSDPYTFYQIGMIYRVEGLKPIQGQRHQELQHGWIYLSTLTEEQCSKLLWSFTTWLP